MDAYGLFADVYDTFMDETPYEEWCSKIIEWMKSYGTHRHSVWGEQALRENLETERSLILDLACGTGTLTMLLAGKGYDVTGIDASPDMLQRARDKSIQAGHDILYICQDMREFELYGTVGCVVCICDSLNYLLTGGDIVQTFLRVNNYLYPGGIFIFDFNTVYKYEEVIGDVTIAENREDCSFIWENYYHKEDTLNEYNLTVFIRDTRESGKESVKSEGQGYQGEYFRRFSETHYQKGYTLTEMKGYLEQAGLTYLAGFDGETFQEPSDTSERIFIVAKENGKDRIDV